MNFNSDNVNRNNNNRYNGQSVRPVQEPELPFREDETSYVNARITKVELLLDLYRAYRDARRHKRYKPYQLQFERNLESNLVSLRDSIWERRYKHGPSSCFIIHDPKMREVFAASFRDRVVHHLFYNYTRIAFEKDFIRDSYSCIKGRGTHFGIDSLRQHILEVSKGFSRPCYVLKLDVKGYFMSIDRERLISICRRKLEISDLQADRTLVDYLLEQIALVNPVERCFRVGRFSDWKGLPEQKSLFHSPAGCGLPIGNLTSQLFSNVYLGEFDNYMVKMLGLRNYGRYVDDCFVVAEDKATLRRIIPLAAWYLSSVLGLHLNRNKIIICSAYMGVEFLGAFLKPWRTYVSRKCLRRILLKLPKLSLVSPLALSRSLNSFLGICSHWFSYNIRLNGIIRQAHFAFDCGYFLNGLLRFRLGRPLPCNPVSARDEQPREE